MELMFTAVILPSVISGPAALAATGTVFKKKKKSKFLAPPRTRESETVQAGHQDSVTV